MADGVVEEGFELAPGDHKFVPLVLYPEGFNGGVSASFMQVLPADHGGPLLPKEGTHILEIRATGMGTGPYDFRCKIWVESGHLRIEEIRSTPAAEAEGRASNSLREAAPVHQPPEPDVTLGAALFRAFLGEWDKKTINWLARSIALAWILGRILQVRFRRCQTSGV
jgi:hypothetical protein